MSEAVHRAQRMHHQSDPVRAVRRAACTESHGHTASSVADRSSKDGRIQAESHGKMAHPTAVRENPLTLLQNSYPDRITAASANVVEELLDMLNMYYV